MTILANLAKHVAWRFSRTSAYERKAQATVVLREAPRDGSTCVRCHRTRDNPQYKHCQRCRTRASLNQKKRRTRLARKGACVKCGRHRDSDYIVCTACRARERARYHARGKRQADMAPPLLADGRSLGGPWKGVCVNTQPKENDDD